MNADVVGDENPDEDEEQLEALLEYVRRARNSDFTGYKRASLTRRIAKRLQALGLRTYGEYLDHLEVHPDEFTTLFNTVLINVTSFFRDPSAWESLRELVERRLVDSRRADHGIRVWSAGTSSGQEAYTLAMLFAEVLGADEFRRRVKIYGTDIDDDALAIARHAGYTDKELESVPAELRDKYFEPSNGELCFRPDLRRAVIFGRHDLVQDAPISRLDLLVCRNTLMYFNAETQARVIDRFHFALADDGLLFVGQAETLMAHGDRMAPVDTKHRIFERAPAAPALPRPIGQRPPDPAQNGPGVRRAERPELLEVSFDAAPVPHVIVDASGRVALINGMARRLFRLADVDLGRPFQDLELSFRPVELRSSIEAAYRDRRPVVHRDVDYPVGLGQSRYLDIEVMPMFDRAGEPAGVSLTFSDVSRHRELQDELAESTRRLEEAYEELQSTNEELETTNEELQSTVEELETTNEELQSTNEELETMNEELQSTNDELHLVNDELRLRGDELDRVNAFLQSILSALRRAVVVLDRDLVIEVWNDRAEDLWGLRSEEVLGKHLLDLDIGLPTDALAPVLQDALDGEDAVEASIPARNRRGQDITCVTVATPRNERDGTRAGLLLLMEARPAASGH